MNHYTQPVIVLLLLIVCHVNSFNLLPPLTKSSTTYRKNKGLHLYFPQVVRSKLSILLASSSFSNASEEIKSVLSVKKVMSRQEGQTLMDEVLLPQTTYGDRIGLGRDAHGIDGDADGLILGNDPRLSMTYGEFPLGSTDKLIDLGLEHLDNSISSGTSSVQGEKRITLVDVGSGCGRLVLYSALTRCEGRHLSQEQIPWTIHGIEIADLLHDEAISTVSLGIQNGLLVEASEQGTNTNPVTNELSFHCGPAEQYKYVLADADIIFSYCTTFPTTSFSPELGAMILGPEWSKTLSESCKIGCIAITTDRALDPMYGWELVDRLEVENPEVFGSIGYIHVLRENNTI